MNSEASELEERPRMDYEQSFEGSLVWALFFLSLFLFLFFSSGGRTESHYKVNSLLENNYQLLRRLYTKQNRFSTN